MLERTLGDALAEMEILGVSLLDSAEGRVGFPTVVNGRKAFFSWRPGDDGVRHWHFATEGDDALIVQLIRGKNLVSEIVVVPGDITYVQGVAGEVEDEFVFELISETDRDRVAAYHFVLSHGYDGQETAPSRRAVH